VGRLRASSAGGAIGKMLVLSILLVAGAPLATSSPPPTIRTTTQAHYDVARRNLERQGPQALADSSRELQRVRREVAVQPQRYHNQGREAAAREQRRRRLQGATRVGYYYSNVQGKLKPHNTSGGWGSIRIAWDTTYLVPTASNPTPDGDRACYAVGQWARRGDTPAGASPTTSGGCPAGSSCQVRPADGCAPPRSGSRPRWL
jgi:hypothetical protein